MEADDVARSFAQIPAALFGDATFRSIPADAQLAYIALQADQSMSIAGIAPFTPRAFARAWLMDPADVESHVVELARVGLVIADLDVDELLVPAITEASLRSGPKVLAGVRAALSQARSKVIRSHLAALLDGASNGVSDADPDTQSEGVSDGVVAGEPAPYDIGQRTDTDHTPTRRKQTKQKAAPSTEAIERLAAARVEAWEIQGGGVAGVAATKAITKAWPIAVAARPDDPEGFLRAAIRGARFDAHYCGFNDNGKVYDGWDNLLRNAERIERFVELYERPGRPRQPGPINRTGVAPIAAPSGAAAQRRSTLDEARQIAARLTQGA